jgi:hypothetical protein
MQNKIYYLNTNNFFRLKMSKILIRIVFFPLIMLTSNYVYSANSYLLEIVCKKESSVTFVRSFWANDDMDAQNKVREILSSVEFQSKGECTVKNLKRS